MAEQEGQNAGLDRGNPAQAADSEAKGAGTFVTGLQQETGSGDQAASQQAAQEAQSAQSKESNQQTGVMPGYAAALTKELKADPKVLTFAGKFKTLDDLVKSAMEADSKLGGMVSIPKDDATDEERRAFYTKLGVPEKPEDYKLTVKGKTFSDDNVSNFQKLAHEQWLTPKQAQAILDNAQTSASVLQKSTVADSQKAANDAEAAMRQEWGDKYDQNLSVMQRGWRAFGDPELAKVLNETGVGNSPAVAKLLFKLGSLVQEDRGVGGQPARLPVISGLDRPGLD